MKTQKITLILLIFFVLFSVKAFAQDVSSTPHVLSLNHGGNVQCVAYHPNGLVLVSGGVNNTIRKIKDRLHLWKVDIDDPIDTSTWHNDDINCLAFSPDGKWLASGDDDGQVLFSKLGLNNESLEEFQAEGLKGLFDIWKNNVKSVAFSPDSTILACGMSEGLFSGGAIFVFDYNGEKWGNRRVLKGHKGDVNSVAFIPKGDSVIIPKGDSVILASASSDDTIQLWDARSNEHLNRLEKKHTGSINSIAFNKNGEFLASGSADNKVILWKSEDSGQNYIFDRTFTGHTNHVTSVAFTSSGDVLSTSKDKTIRVWEPSGDRRVKIKPDIGEINSIAFSFQNKSIASGGDGGTVFQLTYADPKAIGGSMEIIPDFTSKVAHGQDFTYFVLSAQFPTVVGMPSEYVDYKECLFTLGFAHVPNKDREEYLIDPGYFVFPIKTPAMKIQETIRKDGVRMRSHIKDMLISVLYVPNIVLQIAESVGELNRTSDEVLDIMASAKTDPQILITSNLPLDKPIDYLFLATARTTSMSLKTDIEFSFKSENQVWYDATLTQHDKSYDLVEHSVGAPRAEPVSLSDYPLFQQLSPEVQEYLLRYFGELRLRGETMDWQIPEVTSLLPNYPNPFNPETWLPYQLSKPADVTLTIYDIQGRVVRDLDLGHQPAGMYHSRSRAAHWDGRNAQGESVASGLYFYTLKAGDFTATRKMLIRK